MQALHNWTNAGQACRRPALRHWCTCALVWSALLACPPSAGADEVIDRVLAVVSGEVITLSDVRTARELGRVDTAGAPDPVRAALTQLIDRALVLAEVDRFAPPEPAAAAVEAQYAELVSRLGGRANVDSTFNRLGVDESLVRELLREDLRISAYFNQRFVADTAGGQRMLVDDWMTALRKRADIVDLYREPLR